MLVSVVSVGKSLGTTSLALGLAASWAQRDADPTLIELDPSGGDVAGWWGMSVDPGVRSLAAQLAISDDFLNATGEVMRHSQAGPNDLRVVPLPAALEGDSLNRLVSDVGGRWGLALQSLEGPVIADCGSWGPSHLASDRIGSASAVVALVSPDVSGVDRARRIFQGMLRDLHPPRVLAVLAGERPYGVEEVAEQLRGVEVVASLPRDSSAALSTARGDWSKRLSRRPWARVVSSLVDEVEDGVTWTPGGMMS